MSKIINKYKAQPVMEGGGVLVNRVFGHSETKEFDPFLMLDYFDMKGDTQSPGFPWHPHKGMETISYFLRGSGEHEDSMGNKGIISAGELQWMSAGKGVMHQEMPVSSPEGLQGFQFWVNLPSQGKLKEPSYQYIKQGEMKSVYENGSEVKVIAGVYNDIVGPIDKSDRGITMLHVLLEAHKEIVLKRESDKQGFIFLFEGSGTLNEDHINAITAYTLSDGDIRIKSDGEALQFIFAEGVPIKEPIAWHGPIVMNTKKELMDTFNDIEKGTFV